MPTDREGKDDPEPAGIAQEWLAHKPYCGVMGQEHRFGWREGDAESCNCGLAQVLAALAGGVAPERKLLGTWQGVSCWEGEHHVYHGEMACVCLTHPVAPVPLAPPQETEICICAAVQFADGRIVRGHRHDSCFRTAEGWTPKPDAKGHVQGFITSRNRFVGREDGAQLQNAAGIDSAHTLKPVEGELFSEDLYFAAHDHVAWTTPYQEPALPLAPGRPEELPKFIAELERDAQAELDEAARWRRADAKRLGCESRNARAIIGRTLRIFRGRHSIRSGSPGVDMKRYCHWCRRYTFCQKWFSRWFCVFCIQDFERLTPVGRE